jgi:hypothetical protein
VLTSRKPKLLLRFDGELLLRFAERRFTASLFQLPPRFTRFELFDFQTNSFCNSFLQILQINFRAVSLGAQASLPAGREAFIKDCQENQVGFTQRLIRREARRSTQGCVRSQPYCLLFSL